MRTGGSTASNVPEDLSIPRCAACWNERKAYEHGQPGTRSAVAARQQPKSPAVTLAPVAAKAPSAPAQLDLFSDSEDNAA